MRFTVTATTHQGQTVEQIISPDFYADICAFVTNSDYIISNEDRLRIAQWGEGLRYETAHTPFFVHHSQLETLKHWINANMGGKKCRIYIYAGGIEYPNETPDGVVSLITYQDV